MKAELSVPALSPAFPGAKVFHCKHLIPGLRNMQPNPLTLQQVYYIYVIFDSY